jgi:outer membrane protein with beta-barrel domain
MPRLLPGVVVLILAAGSATPLTAQLRDHAFGGFVGLSLSKAGGADVGGESKLVTGTAVGAFLTLGFSRLLALEPQVLMVEKGLKSEEGGLSATIKLTYLQLPLLVKLRFPMGPEGRTTGFLFAGPAAAYRVGCRLKLAQSGNELNGGCDSDGEAESLRSFDSSMIFGLGADVGRATVSLRYDLGLSKLDQSAAANDIKNRALILLAGVRVGMNR